MVFPVWKLPAYWQCGQLGAWVPSHLQSSKPLLCANFFYKHCGSMQWDVAIASSAIAVTPLPACHTFSHACRCRIIICFGSYLPTYVCTYLTAYLCLRNQPTSHLATEPTRSLARSLTHSVSLTQSLSVSQSVSQSLTHSHATGKGPSWEPSCSYSSNSLFCGTRRFTAACRRFIPLAEGSVPRA